MPTMTPKERALAVFNDFARRGVQPLDETGWMNREDVDAIVDPFAAAIREAVNDALERAADLATRPYGDAVQALGGDEPLAVGNKIAAAIGKMKSVQ